MLTPEKVAEVFVSLANGDELADIADVFNKHIEAECTANDIWEQLPEPSQETVIVLAMLAINTVQEKIEEARDFE